MQRSRITTTTVSVIALVVALLAVTSCDWSQFRAGINRTGFVADDAIKPAAAPGLVQRWTGTTGGPVRSSPAVIAGVVYVGSDDGRVYAYNATTGAVEWSVPLGAPVASSPAFDATNMYVGTDDHKLHAIRLSDRAELWSATLDSGFGGLTSVPLVSGGIVFASSATSVYAYKATNGAKLWSTALTATGTLSVPSSTGNVIYVSSYADATVWAYRFDGVLMWSNTVPGPRAACAAATPGPMVSGNVVYATLCPSSAPGAPSLFTYQAATGAPMWSNASTQLSSTPTIGFGPLYAVSSANQSLEARSATDGSLVWSAALGSTTSSSPALADKVVYVATDDHKLRAFDADGHRQLLRVTQGVHPPLDHRRGRGDPVLAGGVQRLRLRRIG